jgi:hypothetical protein
MVVLVCFVPFMMNEYSPRAAELEVSAVSGTPKLALAPLFGTK